MLVCKLSFLSFFFFNDTATTEIYTLSLHDALPISGGRLLAEHQHRAAVAQLPGQPLRRQAGVQGHIGRSEEHTSELQSHLNLVCRLLLEKKKTRSKNSPLRFSIRCMLVSVVSC